VLTLVSIIRGIGDHDETNPNIVRVTFGKLFNYYTSISNKVDHVYYVYILAKYFY